MTSTVTAPVRPLRPWVLALIVVAALAGGWNISQRDLPAGFAVDGAGGAASTSTAAPPAGAVPTAGSAARTSALDSARSVNSVNSAAKAGTAATAGTAESPTSADVALSVAPNQPLTPQRSPDGQLVFDAGFVSSLPGKAVHAASLVELAGGRLRAVWFSGSREGAGDVGIQTAVFDPATARWGAESTLLDRERIERGLHRYVKKLGNPVIARSPDGSLLLWLVNVSLGGWAGSSITWVRSTDDGQSWSAPRRLVTSPFINISTLVKGGPVAYADGSIGLPVYHEFLTKFGEMLRLDTEGRVLDKQRIPGSQTSLQPVVLVRDAQRAQVFMRSGPATAVMASATADGGLTWSATQPTAWPNPDSALAATVAGDGARWFALNPAPRDREILAVLRAPAAGRVDAARRWRVESSATPGRRLGVAAYEQLLTQELLARGATPAQAAADVASARRQLCGAEACSQEFSYPFMLRTGDGAIHLVYTWHRSRIKHVRIAPGPMADPAASKAPGPVQAATPGSAR